MRGKSWVVGVVLSLSLAGANGVVVEAQKPRTNLPVCRQVVLEGVVKAGEEFARPVGGGLQVKLDPLGWGSGWVLRVIPTHGLQPAHDYAELATPPYSSVNPLVISTDFSFRSQDALAWNPRRFRFVPDEREYGRVLDLYEKYTQRSGPAPGVENALAEVVSGEPEGKLEILDAKLVPGMANQAAMAAAVASHFSTTAHTVELPETGKGTPLGRITWFRFRITLDLRQGFVPDHATVLKTGPCS